MNEIVLITYKCLIYLSVLKISHATWTYPFKVPIALCNSCKNVIYASDLDRPTLCNSIAYNNIMKKGYF